MTVMVALLRGINVGGANSLPMAQLRDIAVGCGLRDVRTYVQSGNVVFTTSSRSTASVARTLARAIAERSAVQPAVVVRTRDELAAVVERNPFVGRGADPAHLHVLFAPAAVKLPFSASELAAYAPDEIAAVGSEVFGYFPNGFGRSKLAALLARRVESGTVRNWRTVTTLLRMADELA